MSKDVAGAGGEGITRPVIASTFERHIRIQQIFWFGIIAVFAVGLGYFMAESPILVVLGVGGLGWLILLPYHSRIAVSLAFATFNSALILPYFPGRPYLWEFAGLLAWTGLVITISLRQYRKDYGSIIAPNKWLFIGSIGYCAVLMVTMFYRGFGFRILGNEVMGGRYYFQQLVCAIFPLLFALVKVEERTLVRLFYLQCALTTTYLISDFAFSVAPAQLFFLLQFFELAGDAINFEWQSRTMGIRRFQSLYVVSNGFFFLLLVWYKARDFFSIKGLFLIPATLAVFGVGLLSGHRYLVMIVAVSLLFILYAQRFYNFRSTAIGVGLAVFGLAIAYGFADRLPLAAQRALSILPGISVNAQARDDGIGTLDTRRMLRKAGMDLIPDYFWVGRGFGQAPSDYSMQWDPTALTLHINQGRFYNGFIGLMVNTGVFGTAFMLLFLFSGCYLAWKVMVYLRRLGCEDQFTRMCSVISGLYMANVIAFLALHGDSEYAMKTFSLQAGVLLVCHYFLRKRAGAAGEDA